MDFVTIDDLLDDVMPEVAGCTEFVAQDKIRLAAIEFCRKTHVSQHTIEELDLEANEPLVDLSSPSINVRIYKVLWVKNTQFFMYPQNRQYLANRNLSWKQDNMESEWPTSWVRESSDQIRVIPTPNTDNAGSLEVHVAVIPSRTATKLDATLFDEWREAIISGALAKLLRMSNEDWYDPNSARGHEAEFVSQISSARAVVNKDRTTADTRVQPVFFA